MGKHFIIGVLSVGMCLYLQQPAEAANMFLLEASAVSAVVDGVHPTEAKYDKVLERYAAGLRAAFNEPNDQKTIAMIDKLNDEFIRNMETLKPELERWVKSMSEQDKEEFKKRSETKPYLKSMFELMFDPKVGQRLQQNPKIQEAMDAASQRMKELGFEDNEEGEEEETDGK